MGFIAKLKELFGIDSGRESRAGAGSGVDITVEREAGETVANGDETADEHGAESADEHGAESADEHGDEAAEERVVEADTTTEEAAKEPVATATDASASTESLVEEAVEEDEKVSPAERAEPAEAAGPESTDETTDVDAVEADVDEETAMSGEATETTQETIAAESETAGDATTELKGIGPAYAERLSDAGVESVGELAEADVESLAEEIGVSESRLGRWMERARDHL